MAMGGERAGRTWVGHTSMKTRRSLIYGRRGTGAKLKGSRIAIEPMINLGKRDIYTESDGWTVRTSDQSPSVPFRHDVMRKKGKAIFCRIIVL